MARPALSTDAPPLPGSVAGLPVRALVLDDSAFDRGQVGRLLRKVCGSVAVRDAADLDEFRTALDEVDYDLVMIDYLLVGTTGLTALDVLTEHPRQSGSTAIMVAGEGNLDVALTAMRRGCRDYIPKSDLSVDGLREVLGRALDRTFERAATESPEALTRTVENAAVRFASASGTVAAALSREILRRVGPLCTDPDSLTAAEALRTFREIEMTGEQLLEVANGLTALRRPAAPADARTTQLSRHRFDTRRPN